MSGARKAGLVERLKGALGMVRDDLATVRAEVDRLRSEIEHESSRPVPPATIGARVDATVAYLREYGNARHSVAGTLARPDGGPAGGDLFNVVMPPFALAAMLAPDALRAWLTEQGEAALASLPEPVDDATRAARLAKLRRELAAAERREADLCWESMDVGLDVAWRADLDPAAALGLDG